MSFYQNYFFQYLLLIIYNPNKGDNMKAPKSKGLTMGQLQAYKKASKDSKRKQYWQGRIDALAGQVNYKNWLKKNK